MESRENLGEEQGLWGIGSNMGEHVGILGSGRITETLVNGGNLGESVESMGIYGNLGTCESGKSWGITGTLCGNLEETLGHVTIEKSGEESLETLSGILGKNREFWENIGKTGGL